MSSGANAATGARNRLRGTSSYAHYGRPEALKVPSESERSPQVSPTQSASETESMDSPPISEDGGDGHLAKNMVNVLHRHPRESRFMAETLNPVERDGLVENIYELLRCASHSSGGGSSRFSALRVPDTVIIRNGLIYRWFFTSKNGTVLRKNRSRLHREEVRDALLAKGTRNRSKIVAVYLTSTSARIKPGVRPGEEENSRPPSPATPGRPEDINTHTPVVHCDYLDAAQLRLFLDDDVLQRNGILQAFIEPNTDRMSTIEATFSPAATLIERRLNVSKIDDYRFPAVERMVTFDGADHYTDLVPVQRPQTVAGLKDGCRAIKDHIAGVAPFYLDVGRMVLYLREDSKRQLWLLWCTSFRCTPRPNDPKETNHGPLALHTRMTVDRSGQQGSTRRREKAAGVGSTNLQEKSRVPTTGVVLQDPANGLREWGPEVAEKLTEYNNTERRHLVYNIPPVGLLDVLFEPGATLTGGTPDGYLIKEDKDVAVKTKPMVQTKDRPQRKSAPKVSSNATKISDSEKHRSTRLTKGMELASGELYNDALLICQTAPDLETLKSTERRESERHAAAQMLWNVADEKAREREAERAKLILKQEENKKVQQKTHKVRVLKKHRGIDGANMDRSLTIDDLAPVVALGGTGEESSQSALPGNSGKASPKAEVSEGDGQDAIASTLHGEGGQADAKTEHGEILNQLVLDESKSVEVNPELQRELDMLRGLPRNHPTMMEFIRRQRRRIARGETLVINTEESGKKAAERTARLTRASMGRTRVDAKSLESQTFSKAQLLAVTRRHTNKLPSRRAQESTNRPQSAPITGSAAEASASLGADLAQNTDEVNASKHTRRRIRPVSANVSATTAARWGVHAGTAMVDEASALQDLTARHAKAIKAAQMPVPKPHLPLWKPHESATASSVGGGTKQVAETHALSANDGSHDQQKVPVPPMADKERKSSRLTDRCPASEIAEQRRAAAEQRYRKLLGYRGEPAGSDGGKNEHLARPAHRHRQVVVSTTTTPRGSARPASAAPMMTPRQRGAVAVRPASARPVSSAFGDSDPAARKDLGAKRRVQSARVRGSRMAGATVRARPQSALVPGKTASPRSRQAGLSGDAWLKNVLAETQSLIASVKKDQELYSAEADALQGQLYERQDMNVAAYHHVKVPL